MLHDYEENNVDSVVIRNAGGFRIPFVSNSWVLYPNGKVKLETFTISHRKGTRSEDYSFRYLSGYKAKVIQDMVDNIYINHKRNF